MSAATRDNTPLQTALLAIHFLVLAVTVLSVSVELAEIIAPPPGNPGKAGTELAVAICGRIIVLALLFALTNFSGRSRSELPVWFYPAHAAWLMIFSWYGWLARGGWFLLREVLGWRDDPSTGWVVQQSARNLWFVLLILIYSGIPIWLARRKALTVILNPPTTRISLRILYAISVGATILWFGFPSPEEPLTVIFLVVALCSAAYCAASRQRGALSLLLLEALAAPLVRFLVASH